MKLVMSIVMCLMAGCMDGLMPTDSSPNEKPLRVKTTDDIGEFKGDKQVIKPKVKATNPIMAPLQAYEPMKQRIAGLGIEHAVNLFHATEGRYPKDYEEFMQRIIKENNMRLPDPAKGFSYEYDVVNHKLVVVKDGGE
ncbi:MAG: hypothetical protein MK102_11535 [Fuerstiella sp.]|nr:hypothetical protein [Fuerstiella sp.]